MEIYDGKEFQDGVIKLDVSPDEEDVRVNITWEETFTPIVALLINDISKVFKNKNQTQAGVTENQPSNPARNSRKNSGHFTYDYKGRRKIVEHFREEKNEGKISNSDAWASSKYGITGKTLKSYLDEFPLINTAET